MSSSSGRFPSQIRNTACFAWFRETFGLDETQHSYAATRDNFQVVASSFLDPDGDDDGGRRCRCQSRGQSHHHHHNTATTIHSNDDETSCSARRCSHDTKKIDKEIVEKEKKEKELESVSRSIQQEDGEDNGNDRDVVGRNGTRDADADCLLIRSSANGRVFHVGRFSCPSVGELRILLNQKKKQKMMTAARPDRAGEEKKEEDVGGGGDILHPNGNITEADLMDAGIKDKDINNSQETNEARTKKKKKKQNKHQDQDAPTFVGMTTNDNSHTSTSGQMPPPPHLGSGLTFRHITGVCIKSYIQDPSHADDVIMVASQCNALEMLGPGVSAGDGVSGYAADPTQGPQAALACPAAAVYRNYIAPRGQGQWVGGGGTEINNALDIEQEIRDHVMSYNNNNNNKRKMKAKTDLTEEYENKNGKGGVRTSSTMTADSLACSAGAGAGATKTNTAVSASGVSGGPESGGYFFEVRNGYLLPSRPGRMAELGSLIGAHSSPFARRIVEALRIGVQWSTEVEAAQRRTKYNSNHNHRVTQCFAWACPCAYSKRLATTGDWASFATLVLEGSFLAALLVAGIRAYTLGRRVRLVTTALGHGAFGNQSQWIVHAFNKAMYECRELPVDVVHAHHHRVVSHCFKDLRIPAREPPPLAAVERVVAAGVSSETIDDPPPRDFVPRV